MKIIYNPPTYNGIDILCRVYKNQSDEYWATSERHRDENKQICAEVLFADASGIAHDPKRAYSWLPRGAAKFIATVLQEFKDSGYTSAICNELPDRVGILTSCRENFDAVIEIEIASIGGGVST